MSNKANFLKYSSLENHYNGKHLNIIPQEMKEIEYSVTEKLDGANIQILFRPNEPYVLGKRTSFIENNGEGFFELDKTILKYQEFINTMQDIVNTNKYELRVYGEIYGNGINGRVKYGDGVSKYLKFFDIMLNDVYLTQDSLQLFVNNNNLQSYFVEQTVYPNLMSALSVDVEEANSKALISEGIVIKPYKVNVMLFGKERLVLKKKSLAFADKMEGAHNQNKIKQFDPVILNASTEFKKYITKNRLIDLFSKHGKMTNIKQMGDYIKYYLDDAKSDYVKHNDISVYDEKQLKDVFNVGSAVAIMLRESLNEDN